MRYCCNFSPIPKLPVYFDYKPCGECSSVYGLLSCLQTCSTSSCVCAVCSTAPSLKCLVLLFSQCVVSLDTLLILHLYHFLLWWLRTLLCVRLHTGFNASYMVTLKPPWCPGDGLLQLCWGSHLCDRKKTCVLQWKNYWFFWTLSRSGLVLMSSWHKQCVQCCLWLVSSGVGLGLHWLLLLVCVQPHGGDEGGDPLALALGRGCSFPAKRTCGAWESGWAPCCDSWKAGKPGESLSCCRAGPRPWEVRIVIAFVRPWLVVRHASGCSHRRGPERNRPGACNCCLAKGLPCPATSKGWDGMSWLLLGHRSLALRTSLPAGNRLLQ